MNPLLVPLKICPVAPTGVAAYTDQISGMVLWSVLWLFGIAALVSVGAILVGRATHSRTSRRAASSASPASWCWPWC